MITVTKLPPGPERPELRFSDYQFAPTRNYLRFDEVADLGQETGFSIAYSDEKFFQVQTRAVAFREVPMWALSDRRIRELVCFRIAYLARLDPKDVNFSTLAIAERRALRKLRKANIPEWNEFCECAERNGGLAALFVKIIFGAYRGGKDSVALARETGVDSRCIRQHLKRINDAGRRLWPDHPELFAAKRTYGGRSRQKKTAPTP